MRVMMSKENYTPWDAAEVLTSVNEDGIIEYLIDALEENDPEFFTRDVGRRGTRQGHDRHRPRDTSGASEPVQGTVRGAGP